jgi:hypothetical protein
MLSSNFNRQCLKTYLHVRLRFQVWDVLLNSRQQGGEFLPKLFKFIFLLLLFPGGNRVLNKTLCFGLNNVASGVSLGEHSRGITRS